MRCIRKKTEPGISVLNLALSDYIKAPKVDGIDSSAYQGAVGNQILIKASDDFKVDSVKVTILDSAGGVIEDGDAMQQGDSDDWTYQASVANPTLAGSKINVKATDLPGNETTREITL